MLLGLSVLTSLQAQEAIHTAGGEASGSGEVPATPLGKRFIQQKQEQTETPLPKACNSRLKYQL